MSHSRRSYQGYQDSYMYSTHDDEQDPEYTPYNQYNQDGYTRSAQGPDGRQQQPTYDGTLYTDQQTGLGDWQGTNYSYQDQDPHWNTDFSSYTGSIASTMYNWNQAPSEYAPGDLYRSPIQDHHSEMQQYHRESEAGKAMAHSSRVHVSPPVDWGSTYQMASGYSHYPQTTQGIGIHQNQTPQLLIHPPQPSNLRNAAIPGDASGYIEESPYSMAATRSPMLSPYGQTADDEGEYSSEYSASADGQPDPTDGNSGAGAGRRYACRQEECAGKKPFKRHADLMRHNSTVHHKEGMQKHDCPRRGCPRKGDNGFTRNDHLTEHLRNTHLQEIPKKKGGARSAGKASGR